ncbi:putative marR-family regulatory protein [Roseobacter sp. SK209-2-6]|nr:putative marR-family regulatory protein [Roseobacter sp. SK209-2-6]
MSRPLMQAAESCVENGLSGTGITVRMRAVLEILRAQGNLSVPEIAAKLDIKRQYVQLMVNETLSAGFTMQCPNPRHVRSPLLALTERGSALIDEVIAREMKLMQVVSEEFSEDEIATALKVVLSVTAQLKAQKDNQP